MMNAFDQQTAEANARKLSDEIDHLSGLVGKREYVDEAKSVQQLFNSLRPLARSDRDELWGRYQLCWDQHKEIRAKQAQRREESEQARREIESAMWIDTQVDPAEMSGTDMLVAVASAGFSTLGRPQDWKGMGAKLAGVKGQLDELEDRIRNESRLLPHDRHELFGKLHDLRDQLFQARDSTWSELHDQAEHLYNEAYEAVESMAPREAAEVFKRNQALVNSLYLRPSDKQKFRDWFNELWQKLHWRFDEQRREQEQRHADWRERQETGLQRLQEAHGKLEDFIERIEQNISANEDRLASAWSNDYVERYSAWINEDQEKLRDAQESLAELNRKIEDAENRLRS